MRYAVALYFDQESEDVIRTLWEDIATQVGVPRLPEVHPGSRPHISFAVYGILHRNPAHEAVNILVERLQVFHLTLARFCSLAVPGATTGTLYWQPDASPNLSRIHAHLHEGFPAIGADLSKYYRLGQWPAHCALATKVDLGWMPAVIEWLDHRQPPLETTVSTIGFAEFHPVRILYETGMKADTTREWSTTSG